MVCIATTLTLLSVLTGGEWNDVSVTTNARIVADMHEQVSAKVEMISETVRNIYGNVWRRFVLSYNFCFGHSY